MQKLLKELFCAHYRDIYTYLYSLSRSASLSEDLTSEVFLEAVKSIAGFRGESDAKTWLFTIARRRWYAYLRRQNRQIKTESLREFCTEHTDNAETRCLEHTLAARIHELLNAEPERTRSIVLMRLDGFSFYEIGLRHGISENSARVIDFRAKAKIRKKLSEEGYDEE